MKLIPTKPNYYINPEQVVSVEYKPESSREGRVPHPHGGIQQGTILEESNIVVTLSVGEPIRLRGKEADALAAKLSLEPIS